MIKKEEADFYLHGGNERVLSFKKSKGEKP